MFHFVTLHGPGCLESCQGARMTNQNRPLVRLSLWGGFGFWASGLVRRVHGLPSPPAKQHRNSVWAVFVSWSLASV